MRENRADDPIPFQRPQERRHRLRGFVGRLDLSLEELGVRELHGSQSAVDGRQRPVDFQRFGVAALGLRVIREGARDLGLRPDEPAEKAGSHVRAERFGAMDVLMGRVEILLPLAEYCQTLKGHETVTDLVLRQARKRPLESSDGTIELVEVEVALALIDPTTAFPAHVARE
ncbi:MAG TPA: hypothetical protein VGG06_28215, partial [Thermoanaerobaculia bacterium]